MTAPSVATLTATTGDRCPVFCIGEAMALISPVGSEPLAATSAFDEFVTVAGSAGANAEVKVGALVAGMVAGADSISDMDLIRHGGMSRAWG